MVRALLALFVLGALSSVSHAGPCGWGSYGYRHGYSRWRRPYNRPHHAAVYRHHPRYHYVRPHRVYSARQYYRRHGYYRPRYSYRYRTWIDLSPYVYGTHFCGGSYRVGGYYGAYTTCHPYYYWNPHMRLAPIYSRFGTVFTIDDDFTGPIPQADADGLPQRRAEPVGSRFLVSLE